MYDSRNIFARIIAGEVPCVKLFEDSHILAIMDTFPEAPGHCLVLPKEFASSLYELSSESAKELILATKKLATAVHHAYPDCGVVLMQLNGHEAGQSVMHVHMHVIPRKLGAPHQPHGRTPITEDEISRNAQKIKAFL